MVFLGCKLSKKDKDKIEEAWRNNNTHAKPMIVLNKPSLGIFDAFMLSLIPLSIGIAIGFVIGRGM